LPASPESITTRDGFLVGGTVAYWLVIMDSGLLASLGPGMTR
jgi:hypothetical protein